MHFEYGGMRLWIERNELLTGGTIDPGSDVDFMVGVEPADASNRVQLRYRVNGGSETAVDAELVRQEGTSQYFKARLPSTSFREGDTVEYTAMCLQCSGRQVPSPREAEQFPSSFRVGNRMTASNVMAPTVNGQSALNSLKTETLKPTHLSLFALSSGAGHPIARLPFLCGGGCYQRVTTSTRD